MQNKVLQNRLKKLERRATGGKKTYVFFGLPRRAELNKIPQKANIIVFVGEDKIPD